MQDPNNAIWQSYSIEKATFYASLQMTLPPPSTDSAEACAQGCLDNDQCIFW